MFGDGKSAGFGGSFLDDSGGVLLVQVEHSYPVCQFSPMKLYDLTDGSGERPLPVMFEVLLDLWQRHGNRHCSHQPRDEVDTEGTEHICACCFDDVEVEGLDDA